MSLPHSILSRRPAFKAFLLSRHRAFSAFSFATALLIGSIAFGAGGWTARAQSLVAPPSSLEYRQNILTCVVAQAIRPDIPTVTGTVSSFSISPALPAGLILNKSTGEISGIPTAAHAAAIYVATAKNAGGSATEKLEITVSPAVAPGLFYPQTVISAVVGQPIVPDVPAPSGMAATHSIKPALPAGLIFHAATGVIAGTPTARSPRAQYTVTTKNSEGTTTAAIIINIAKAQDVLLELGHAVPISAMRFVGDRLLSLDESGHWVLWNYSTAALIASGDGVLPLQSGESIPNPIETAGQIFTVAITNGVEFRSLTDGHLISTFAYPGLNVYQAPYPAVFADWWLASDASYICVASEVGFFVYTPGGHLLVSRTGDYGGANIFAAPGRVLIANSPAGANVIETISTTGAVSVSRKFSGQFNSWFLDGSRFLTNLDNTVWVYSTSAVQQAIVSLPTVQGLTGQGKWMWTYGVTVSNNELDIYHIGSATPEATFVGDVINSSIFSGETISILTSGTGQLNIIDLSGSIPTETTHSVPVAHLTAYAAASPSEWVVGNEHGALVDGASLSGQPRYFGQGDAWSIAGATGRAAVSTAIGEILLYDPPQPTIEKTIYFSAGKVALSANGSVLGASANANDDQYEPDRTLVFFSLPVGDVISSFPYTSPTGTSYSGTDLFDFTLAASGETIGQLTGVEGSENWVYTDQVSPISGSPVTWSGRVAEGTPILLSPDGTLNAESIPSGGATWVTNILKNGKLVAAISGEGVGWIDNNRLLVNQYVMIQGPDPTIQFANAAIFSATGTQLSTPALPEIPSIQTVNSNAVYDPSRNVIYSLSTGKPIWAGAYPSTGAGITSKGPIGHGAISGNYVVYQSNHTVVVEPD
jgi:hypothetical protein